MGGKIYKKKEFVIDKYSKILDLKVLIASLLKKSDAKCYGQMEDGEIAKNISIAKGFSTTPMRLSNINRVQWVHRVALQQIGVDPDAFFYKLLDDKEENEMEIGKEEKIKKHTDLEIMTAMQKALQLENDEVVGRPPFHLRNGDLVVWTDISWKPNAKQIEEKKELVKEEKKKQRGKLTKNPKFKGSKKDTFLSKIRKEPQSLKIRAYEEFMEDERRKKEMSMAMMMMIRRKMMRWQKRSNYLIRWLRR